MSSISGMSNYMPSTQASTQISTQSGPSTPSAPSFNSGRRSESVLPGPPGLRLTDDKRYVLWDAGPEYQQTFLDWWSTTTAAIRITNSSKENHPCWTSHIRRHKAWDNYQQCAKYHDGEPHLVCIWCAAYLRHPTVKNTGTTNLIAHLKAGACKKKRRVSGAGGPLDAAFKASTASCAMAYHVPTNKSFGTAHKNARSCVAQRAGGV